MVDPGFSKIAKRLYQQALIITEKGLRASQPANKNSITPDHVERVLKERTFELIGDLSASYELQATDEVRFLTGMLAQYGRPDIVHQYALMYEEERHDFKMSAELLKLSSEAGYIPSYAKRAELAHRSGDECSYQRHTAWLAVHGKDANAMFEIAALACEGKLSLNEKKPPKTNNSFAFVLYKKVLTSSANIFTCQNEQDASIALIKLVDEGKIPERLATRNQHVIHEARKEIAWLDKLCL